MTTIIKRVDYRKLALAHYRERLYCAYCGFGIVEVLEVAHLDGHRHHNQIENLALLCPTCHKMLDLDIIPTEIIVQMRDRERVAKWKKRMKDAGKKAAESRKRREKAARLKWRKAGLKAAATRAKNKTISD